MEDSNKKVLNTDGNRVQFAWVNGEKVEYTPVCPLGKSKCVIDPMFIKYNHPHWWKDLGCPTECDCYKEGMTECSHYRTKEED